MTHIPTDSMGAMMNSDGSRSSAGAEAADVRALEPTTQRYRSWTKAFTVSYEMTTNPVKPAAILVGKSLSGVDACE